MKKNTINYNAVELIRRRIAGESLKTITENVDVREPAVRAYFEVIGLVGEGIVLDLNITGLLIRIESSCYTALI
jgi:hypothetical protein